MSHEKLTRVESRALSRSDVSWSLVNPLQPPRLPSTMNHQPLTIVLREGRAAFRGFQRVVQEHGNCHGSDAAWHGRNPARSLADWSKIHVPHERTIGEPVHAYIHHHRPSTA